MRFIHAADLHIDSPMRGLAAYDDAPVDRLRGAGRGAVRNLVRHALDHQVDLVVLAGDVFDGDWPDFNTGLFFTRMLTELTREGVAVVVLAGNHDAQSTISRHLDLPVGAHRLDHRAPQTIRPDELGLEVAVHGQSYATREVLDDLAAGYPARVDGVCNIGVLHTALTGRAGHDAYAPCRVDELRAKGYDYWALGHVHEREVVATDPWIVFPGNLQGRHAREVGPKGFTVVDVDGSEVVDVTHHDADVARWARCEVDASSVADRHELLDLVATSLADAADDADGRLVAARVVLEGATHLHDELHARREALDAEVRSRAFGAGDVWVEKVQVTTRRPVDVAALADRDDAVGSLLGAIADLRDSPDELVERYASTFDRLQTKLPADVLEHGIDGATLLRALDDAEAHIATLLAEQGEP